MAAGNITRHVQVILSVVNRASKPVGRATNDLWHMVSAARAALYVFQGFKEVATHFMAINNMFEQLELSFAGVMHAKGLTNTFKDAQGHARNLVEDLRKYAAVLPGELEDFVDVAKHAYMEVANAGFKSTSAQAKFLSDYAATAIQLQVRPAQAGRDLMHMLSGHVRHNTRMWSLLRHEIGYTGDDAIKRWKLLTDEQRATAITKALGHYKKMLEAAELTWDAIEGTFKTHMMDIQRYAFEDIFERVKGSVHAINNYLKENLHFMAGMVNMAMKLIVVMGPLMGMWYGAGKAGMIGQGGRFLKQGLGTKIPLGVMVGDMAAFFTRRGGGAALGGRGGAGLLGALSARGAGGGAGAGLLGLLQTGRMSASTAGLERVFGRMIQVAAVASGLLAITGALLVLGSAAYVIANNYNGLRDILAVIFDEIIGYFDVLRVVNISLSNSATLLDYISAMIQTSVEAIASIFQMLAAFSASFGVAMAMAGETKVNQITMLADLIGSSQKYAADIYGGPTMSLEIYAALLKQVKADAKDAGKGKFADLLSALKQPRTRSPSQQINFNNARFSITQMFAEGFDPDRIAVAFAQDVAGMANQKIHSQLAPIGAAP